MSALTITFVHHGQRRTLAKHPKIRHALKHGNMTLDEAKQYPWFLRLKIHISGEFKDRSFKLTHLAKDKVIIEARDFLTSRVQRPNEFVAFINGREAARSITIGELAGEWICAGLPFRKTAPRTPEAAARLKTTLHRALHAEPNFGWSHKPVATITQNMLEDYAAHRAPALRSADVELNALSCLCKWALLAGKIPHNPFGTRPEFSTVASHCHEACPDNDDVLHRVVAWLFETPVHNRRTPASQNIVCASWLMFTALSGLRPGEPRPLLKLPPLGEVPTSPAKLPPGTIFPDRSGQLRMKIIRSKRGQNPFVTLHPALEEFLSAWRAWLARNMPESSRLFPLQTSDQAVFVRSLEQASRALELPHFTAHGFGRAYYVRVRRAQGADDSTIGGELGQAGDGELIRSVYGHPDDLHGGDTFDWLPDTVPVAWSLLTHAKPKHHALGYYLGVGKGFPKSNRNRDTSKDTSGHAQDRGNMGQHSHAENPETANLDSIGDIQPAQQPRRQNENPLTESGD